ncbi:energy transducer TonB [Marilutibacter aestuarii]|uniref:Energy transducer TonB n=1 Tax=Marilutibacter aestuarii TaxID=1706195 RepID=A0A508A3F6_9GAMM|nr:energy transducer TonB [Lysobacter aestuarii]TQD43271.1 energy transducer TonB [Lysobacter aestuarii]
MHRHTPHLVLAVAAGLALVGCQPADTGAPVVRSTEVMAVHTPPPDYPLDLSCNDIGGKVTMKVVVGPEGRPTEIVVLSGSGAEALDRAARDGVQAWEFKPATRNGAPVPQTIQVPMNFTPTPDSELCQAREQRAPNEL